MATLAKLVVKLITDVNEFTKGMDTAVNKYAKIGKSMASIGDKMTLGVTLPIVAAGGAAIKLASDLNETRNKAGVVFGSMSDDMLDWGKTAIDVMGLSENHALSYASTMGSILKNTGLTEDATASMSKTLTSLTSDYKSFHNMDIDLAFEKIRAGMVGSSEPLLSLGIDLRQAAVQAYAARNGIGELGRELTMQELTLARFGALMEQSNTVGVVGDYLRTANSFANLAFKFKELTADTLAKFGETLLPIATDFMKALIPIMEGFNKLPQPIKSAIVDLAIFTAALGPLMSGGGRLLQAGKGLQGLLGKAGLTSLLSKLGVTAVGAGGSLAGVGSAILAVLGPALLLGAAIAALVLAIKYFGPQAFETFKMLSIIAGATFQRLEFEFKQMPIRFGQWIGNSLKALRSKIGDFSNIGKYLMSGFVTGVTSMANMMVKSVLEPVMKSVYAVKGFLGIASDSKLLKKYGQWTAGGFISGIKMSTPAVASAGTQMAQASVGGVSSGISGSGRGSRSVVFADGAIRIVIDGELGAEKEAKLEAKIMGIFDKAIQATFGEATA